MGTGKIKKYKKREGNIDITLQEEIEEYSNLAKISKNKYKKINFKEEISKQEDLNHE